MAVGILHVIAKHHEASAIEVHILSTFMQTQCFLPLETETLIGSVYRHSAGYFERRLSAAGIGGGAADRLRGTFEPAQAGCSDTGP